VAYNFEFGEDALKEWKKLDSSVKNQLLKIFERRLQEPRIPSAALSGMPDCYKIKLRKACVRLVYRVQDKKLLIQVIAIGKRDKSTIYAAAVSRLQELLAKEKK